MNAAALLAFIRQHRLAVQTSVSVEGGPQAAVVGIAVTDDFEIVFDTLESTRKAQNLRRNGKMSFVIGGLGAGDERSVQYEGVADEPAGRELERLKGVYYAVHPDGSGRLGWQGLIYVRARPTWIRYSDYNSDPPEIAEFAATDLSVADTAADVATDERQIRGLVAKWHVASRAGDVDTMLDLMTDDVVFLVPGRAPLGKQEFAALSRAPAGAARPQIDSHSEIQEIRVSGDIAFMWTKLSVVVTSPDGQRVERAGHTLTMLLRAQGRWLLARDANLLAQVR
jgi:uncharacterized protein (TIGR02246 family)